ncbi:hypothetical protein HYR99_05595 [Candidatus Poribacteria bacterium]|nr:hypothetical protein [Candidatus Poribacteria bacterium]
MLTTGIEMDGMLVFLDVEQSGSTVTTKVLICKPRESPLIFSNMVSVILETADGSLLKPTGLPDPGILRETHLRGATAHAQFTFDADTDVKLKRAIVFLRGNCAEFKLN